MVSKQNRRAGRIANIPNYEGMLQDGGNQTAGSRTTGKVVLVLDMTSRRGIALPPLTEHVIILRGSQLWGLDRAEIQSPD